jgi:hypothetical protein
MVMGKRRVSKCLVQSLLCGLGVMVGAQIYVVRELLAALLLFSLLFCALGIVFSIFVLLCETSWRGMNWLAAHATPIGIRLRHPMVRVSAGEGSKN